MMKCIELFGEEIIFDFDVSNPIYEISLVLQDSINDENLSLTLNPELKRILVDESQSFTLDYLVNRYDKYLSPLYMRLYNHYNDVDSANLQFAKIVLMKFLYGWNKLAEAVFGDYNPIENYNMKENRKTDFEEHTVTDTDETVTNKYSGFNTDQMKDVSESATEGNIDTTKTDTGSSANNELTRSGNIGVTTSQQMIESSFNLAKKNLLDVIYKDIDSILFIDYYC